MPAANAQLTRGAVCLALYPFRPGVAVGPQPPHSEAKLRRVLLLQDGTSDARDDVMAARINSVDQDMPTKKPGVYRRLISGTHPTFYLIGAQDSHGTSGREAYVNAMYVAPVAKKAILRRVGQLTPDEMRDVSERVVTSLELDISGLLSRP